MADLAIIPRGAGWLMDGSTAATDTCPYDDAAIVGDYVLAVASVDYLAAASNPAAPTCPTVSTWTQLAAAADPASGSTVMSIKAWLGRITSDPRDTTSRTEAANRTVSIAQSGSSGMHIATRTLFGGSSDATIALDGTAAALVDRATPYTHTTITPTGTRDLLVLAFGAVQFSGTLAFGAPASVDEAAQFYVNQYSGLQVATQQLTAAAATGTRDQTSNIATLSGGAGLRFLLRSQGTAPSTTALESSTRFSFAA